MDTNKTELSMDELEMVNGGADAKVTVAAAGVGACLGGGAAGVIGAFGLGLAAGPVGWVILGGAAVGAAAFGTFINLKN